MGLFLAMIYAFGSLICHQRPERSFFWAGHPFPVCARCTGIYLSGAVALLLWVGLKSARRWRPLAIDPRRARSAFLLAALPTVLSLATAMLGVWDGSNLTRALLAIPLGACAGAIVAAVGTKDLR
jgi:uncharacterized membrane protein